MTDGSPLSRYTKPLLRWWFVIVSMVALGLIATALTLPDGPREPTEEELADPDVTFRATHLLIRNQASSEPINFDLVQLLSRQGDLTNRVVDRMDGQVTGDEVEEVALAVDPSLGTMSITAIQPTPELAALLATTYAQELQGVIDERASDSLRQAAERIAERLPDLNDDLELLEERIAALPADDLDRRLLEAEFDVLVGQFATEQAQLRSLTERIASLEPQFETLQEPSPVATAAREDGALGIPQSPVLRFAIFGFLALLAGVLLVLGIDRLDTRVRTREDAERAFGLPVVAELPPDSNKVRDAQPVPVTSDPTGITAEAFRSLRLSILLAPTWRLAGGSTGVGSLGTMAPVERQAEPRTLLVTSSLTGEGKSTTVANLAASFAESGQDVLVVDCDFRRPAVGKLVGVGPGRGLRDLDGPQLPGLEALIVPTDIPRVQMIRSGEPGIAPSWFLNSARSFISRSRELADIVIFDTGPITLTNEASALIPFIDATLLVNRATRLTRAQARGTIEQLARLGAAVAGIVLIGTNGAKRYGYYSPDTTRTRKQTKQDKKSNQATNATNAAKSDRSESNTPSTRDTSSPSKPPPGRGADGGSGRGRKARLP